VSHGLSPILTEPLAAGLDLGSVEAGEAQREILRTKRPLRHIYTSIYRGMLDAAGRDLTPHGGIRLELGSGGGFLQELDPSVVTSDVKEVQGIDRVIDAQDLPFGDGELDVIFAMHVLHHIPDVRRFLHEAERCLAPGGGIVCVEPYWSPLATLMYRRFHPEPFDPQAPTWGFESTGPLSSNQALSYLMLERDRPALIREFPGFDVIRHDPFGGPSYLLTGGIWKRAVLPASWLTRLWDWEDRRSFWRRALALHHLFVLRRRT
jgi:SAM-dependent methyltransferase